MSCQVRSIFLIFFIDAKHLISRLITVDPKKRATMREVFSHPWVNEGFPFEPEDSYIQPSPIKHIHDLSQDIVGRLIIFGYSREDIIKAFEKDQELASPNPIRSTYYLLQDMVEREQSRFKGKNPAHINEFLKKKECSSLTLVSSSEHSLYSMPNNSIHPKASTDKIQSPPGAHLSQRSHSDKTPAHDMDLMSLDPSKHVSSNSNDHRADPNSKGLFGFSLAQVAVSQIQKLYSVPSSIYNSISGTTPPIGQNKESAFGTTVPQNSRTNNTKPIKKDPRAIVNDIIRVLSGTDARWHFESEFRIICEMDANSYLPSEMEIEEGVGVSQPKKYIGPKTVTFSIEIGKNPNNHYGVYFRRLHGGVWNYKRICTKLVQMMKL
jgi:serine/threonine protein kinase